MTIQENPRPRAVDYQEARRRKQHREMDIRRSAQDCAPIPDVEDIARRLACAESFRLFCETYFPTAFYWAWSPDHLRVIGQIERAVREGGMFAFAMPRASGKTTVARCAALWAVLYGYRPFVCLIGAAAPRAKELLLPIRKSILENPLLAADFPDAMHPLRALENSSKRQLQQHCNGKLTHVHWGQDKLVFPTIEGDDVPQALRDLGMERGPACGSLITVTSLDSNIRGQQHSRTDGTIIRPSLVLLDDPQTRESARSLEQTRKRLELLNGDVMGMAGPGESISAMITCTKMYEDDLADRLLDREKSPEWESECTKLVHAWPKNAQLWERYVEIRGSKGRGAGTSFYAEHRAEMDEGAELAWPERFEPKTGELSALQHAVNLKLKVGPDAFAAEYQNEPSLQQSSEQTLTMDQVTEKVNGHPRGEIPPAATKLTAFIDLHDKMLYYAVCAWADDFTGFVVDYGTFPDQRRPAFTMADSTRTLGRTFPGHGVSGAIQAGLDHLVSTFLARDWNRGGSKMRIDRLLVDMGYKPNVVAAVKQKSGGAAMMLAKGIGIRASRKPIAEYVRHPGETIGHYWYIPNVRKTGQFAHVLVDVNYWKRFVHDGFTTAPGDRGSITLWGKVARDHELLAEHVARSERWVEVTGPGGTVREWNLLPSHPDNHWLDCLVGCAAAASMCGVSQPGMVAAPRGGQRKKYTQAQLRRH